MKYKPGDLVKFYRRDGSIHTKYYIRVGMICRQGKKPNHDAWVVIWRSCWCGLIEQLTPVNELLVLRSEKEKGIRRIFRLYAVMEPQDVLRKRFRDMEFIWK
jgi:hypothetical protein